MNPDQQQFQLIRTLRGAPATILILLMIRGASMTNLEICRWTGYSDKPVTTALITLQRLGLVQDNGRAHGWSLTSGARQLPLPLVALDQPEHISSSPQPAGASAGGAAASRTQPQSTELSTARPEIGIIPISGPGDRNNSDLPAPSAAAADLFSSPDQIPDQQQQIATDRKISDLQLLVKHLGIRNPARATLLAAPPAAVLAWWWASLLDDAGELTNPVGWFIRRVQNNEPPPDDLHPIARAWLTLSAHVRRDMARAECYTDAEAIWFTHGLGPTSAELAHQVARAGGLDYADW